MLGYPACVCYASAYATLGLLFRLLDLIVARTERKEVIGRGAVSPLGGATHTRDEQREDLLQQSRSDPLLVVRGHGDRVHVLATVPGEMHNITYHGHGHGHGHGNRG